jgi:hypothetical protein
LPRDTLPLRYLNRLTTGSFTLTLMKTQGDSQPLKRLVTVPEDTPGVFFGRVKDQGGGGDLVDAVTIAEGVVTQQQLAECELFDKADEYSALRYRVTAKIPPRGRERNWILTCVGSFKDTTPVDL